MAAQQGTLKIQASNGVVYSIDIHCPDAAGTQVCFNPSGAAASTSPNTLRVPSSGAIKDVSVAASPTATGCVIYINSGAVNGGAIRYANQLNSLANRPPLNIPVKAGDFISILQHA